MLLLSKTAKLKIENSAEKVFRLSPARKITQLDVETLEKKISAARRTKRIVTLHSVWEDI
jgi:hypothetical protein